MSELNWSVYIGFCIKNIIVLLLGIYMWDAGNKRRAIHLIQMRCHLDVMSVDHLLIISLFFFFVLVMTKYLAQFKWYVLDFAASTGEQERVSNWLDKSCVNSARIWSGNSLFKYYIRLDFMIKLTLNIRSSIWKGLIIWVQPVIYNIYKCKMIVLIILWYNKNR